MDPSPPKVQTSKYNASRLISVALASKQVCLIITAKQ